MTSATNCPECGATLPPDARRGVCPRCLLRRAFEPVSAEADSDSSHSVHLVPADGTTTPLPFREFGDFELLEQIGHGGMGVIFKARQRSLDRVVALKLISSGSLARAGDIARFRTEASAAARLQHPHIVAIYEVGEHDGQNYYSMEFVPGRSLAHVLREGPLPPKRAARLLQSVAEAIHFAHDRSVLHRDLKPSNILLDADQEPRIADFGLAKLLLADSELTLSGAVLGSPQYMPPEQARGRNAEVSVRSEVYSLGAILYEMLTGRPPFAAATPLETLKLVIEQDPIPPRALNPLLPRDLETICFKCLAKEQSARYTSAQELAEELARFLRNEPVRARPMSIPGHAWRWCRRKPALATLGVLLAAAPAIIIAVLLLMTARVARERNLTLQEHNRMRLNLYAADVFIAKSAIDDGNFGVAYQALEPYVPSRAGPPSGGSVSMGAEPQKTAEAGTTNSDRLNAELQTDVRDFEWYWLWRQAHGEALAILQGHSNILSAVAFSPDSRLLASCANDGTARLWDCAQGRLLATLPVSPDLGSALDFYGRGHPPHSYVPTVSFSADGQLLGAFCRTRVSLWNPITFQLAAAQTNLQVIWGAFHPREPRRLIISDCFPASANPGRFAPATRLGFFDASLRPADPSWNTTSLVFCVSADGRWLAEGYLRELRSWDLSAQKLVASFGTNASVWHLALSPDGSMLAACYQQRNFIGLWDPHTGQSLGTLDGHTGSAMQAAFSPDGRWLASAGQDEMLRLWDVRERREIRQWRGHGLGVRCVAFSPDGELLASGGADRTVRLWRVEPLAAVPAITNVAPPLAFSPDGRWLAAPQSTGELALWALASRRKTRTWTSAPPAALLFPCGEAGLVAATLPANGAPPEAWNYDPASDARALRFRLGNLPSPATCLAFTPDGLLCVTGHRDGSLRWWAGRTGQLLSAQARSDPPVKEARFSPDGRFLMTRTFWPPGVVQTWQVTTRKLLASNRFPNAAIFSFAFAPDGQRCAVGGQLLDFAVWHTATLEPLGRFAEQRNPVHLLSWSPGGGTLASATLDGTLRLWHVPTGRRLATLWERAPGTHNRLEDLAFSADGQWLGACDSNGALHLWQASAPAEINP